MLRTHTCGELRRSDVGKHVILCGWVRRLRDHGGLLFVDLEDRYGIVQVVFGPDSDDLLAFARDELRSDFVVMIEGDVRLRPKGMANPHLPTGEIEISASHLRILNRSEVLPFVVEDDVKASEELRLRYRYLDLRRAPMKSLLGLRHRVVAIIRGYLNERDFWEIETPILAKSTPEGARDYLVPSRLHPGKFYALAQSPQLYKQLLMVAGVDRYYQIARCFRDEDQRGDRQPEFTQLDVEMSFVDEEDVFSLMEGLMYEVFSKAIGVELEVPFPRLTYYDAIQRYGTDKPDLRFGMEIEDWKPIFSGIGFRIIADAKIVAGIVVPHLLSRRDIDRLTEVARKAGGSGLLWIKRDGELSGPPVKFFDNGITQRVLDKLPQGHTLLLVAGMDSGVYEVVGTVRLECANILGVERKGFSFVWITGFPLFEKADDGGWEPAHHIFTMPIQGDEEFLDTDPGKVRGRQYDLVLNGVELASGSIRNHDPEVQRKLFRIIGLSDEEIANRFGFLLEALGYGAPPHGGIAPGLDRLVMIMAGRDTIRDVMAFPKTLQAVGLVEGCPSYVPEEHLRELHLRIVNGNESKTEEG